MSSIKDRGFASMDRALLRELTSKGGKAAHRKGTAHEWDSEEARAAGRKGGIATAAKKRREAGVGSPADIQDPISTPTPLDLR